MKMSSRESFYDLGKIYTEYDFSFCSLREYIQGLYKSDRVI